MNVHFSTLANCLYKILIPPFLMSQNPIHRLLNIIKHPLRRKLVTIPLALEIPRPHKNRIPSKFIRPTNVYIISQAMGRWGLPESGLSPNM